MVRENEYGQLGGNSAGDVTRGGDLSSSDIDGGGGVACLVLSLSRGAI